MNHFAVIFDLDGVITDSEPFMDRHRVGYLKELGVSSVDESLIQSLRGVTGKNEWEVYKKHYSLSQPLDDLRQGFRERYLLELGTASDIRLISNVEQVIIMLKDKGIPLGIASSSSMEKIKIILNRFKLDTAFDCIISGHDVERGKPAPDIYLLAAKCLGMKPKHCVAIEDAENGIKSAKSAGMKVIAYLPIGSLQNTSEAHVTLTDFKDLSMNTFAALSSNSFH